MAWIFKPYFNEKNSPFATSFIIGCMWGVWHLNYASQIIMWLLFIITTIELSIIMTFFLNKSDGNLWPSIIFHTFFNIANHVILWERFNTEFMLIEVFVFGVVAFGVVLADKERMFAKPIIIVNT